MAQRRPYISYNKKGYGYSSVGYTIPTYAEVKKRMAEFLNDADDNTVCVYRKRRGNWGEWFEHWQFNYKRKPVIVKQGWM
jgi:hypothetical protein